MPTIDVVTARDGRVIPIQWNAGEGCTGCIAGREVACYALPNCSSGSWIKLQNAAALGPYFEAYERAKEPTSRSVYYINWDEPKRQVESLQDMVCSMRGYDYTHMPYAVKTALDKFGLPKDWHKLALEFPVDVGDGLIGFCATTAKQRAVMLHGNDSQRTVTTIGRYIRRHWPEAKDHEIRDVTALAETNGVTITYDMDEMIDAVQDGPASCMQWVEAGLSGTWYMTGEQYPDGDDDEPENDITTVHPYHAYDPELGWGMAVRKEGSRIVARALVYEKDGVKCFVRSYGEDSDGYSGSDVAIDAYLKHKGYEYLDAWPEGVKLKAVKHEGGDWCVPYVDPGPNRIAVGGRRFKLDGDVFVRDNDGEYVFGETDGSYSYIRRATRVASAEAHEALRQVLEEGEVACEDH